VSQASREELVGLGVDRSRIAVVHNGPDFIPPGPDVKTAHPSICVVGRLVPHKQVEHAIEAWDRLRHEIDGLRLTIVGSGWWEENLKEYAATFGPGADVEFTGHVSEADKHRIYAESWVMALPSLKEGWGLVVGEAAMHGTPTVAYRAAGGTRESIAHARSGLLVDDFDEFTDALRSLLTDDELRLTLGTGAREMSHRFTWDHAQGSFSQVLDLACHGRTEAGQDPEERS
jgi:glycosyltransferase involved in cell wall biosynthesis